MDHFARDYATAFGDFLHRFLISTWHYKLQVYEIPDLLTALLVNYDDQEKDEFELHTDVTYEDFLARMALVKPDWINFNRENFEGLTEKPQKRLYGWEGRTIYVLRGAGHLERWSPENAVDDARHIILASAMMQGTMLKEEVDRLDEAIPIGREHYQKFENFVRVAFNYLFNAHLGEAQAQVRTEAGNEGSEIRDLLAANLAREGIFNDLKMKYSASEILVDVKNKTEIDRDDLRQIYCYLKPAVGLWGFIVCRATPTPTISSYNRTLFKNFIQSRGVLILTDEDIGIMIDMKLRERDPSEHIASKYSEFIKGI